MNFNSCTLVYFSPTGGTEKVGRAFVSALSEKYESYDISVCREYPKRVFGENDYVVFAVPVFAGRVPVTATERIRSLKGNSTPCSVIAVYGNRAYEDALLELRNTVYSLGFAPVSAGAFIAEHSMVNKIGQGRPDKEDYEEITQFAEETLNKLTSMSHAEEEELIFVKGNSPYREYPKFPTIPLASDACIGCNACYNACPVKAINENNPRETDSEKCISCMRCIKLCPTKARALPEAVTQMISQRLAATAGEPKKPDFFI